MKKTILIVACLMGIFHLSSGQWTHINLPAPRAYMGATVMGSKAYFAGGQNSTGLTSIVEIYNATTGAWEEPKNLSVARDLPFATSCGSKIIFAGGADFFSTQTVYATIDIFDTLTQQWTVKQLSVPRLQAAVASHGDTVLFAGGANLQQQISYDIVDIYNVQTDQWSTATLSEPRSTWWAVVGDLAIFAGGYDFPTASKRVDIYNFSTNTWSIDSLSVARAFVGMTTIGNKVLIAGGMTNDNQPSNVVDIYDASTGIWTVANLSVARAFCDNQNAVSACGKAYFIGGGFLNLNGAYWYYASDAIDIYDEGTNTWSVDTLDQSFVHRAVVSFGDQFLVAGGVSINNVYKSDVDIYTCPSSCLPQGIIFNTQSEIDNYQADHPGCTEIEGNVSIAGSDISDLNGLSVLTSIGGDLKIYGTSLVNLTGLNSISFIGGSFSMGINQFGCNGNDMLTDFTGLEVLSTIGGNLNIICNEILTDLSGLDSVTFIGGNLNIFSNDSLYNCDVYSICEYLANQNASIEIHDNAPGCNSQQQVVDACNGVGVPQEVVSHQSSVVSYPNPTDGIFNVQFTVYNLQRITLKMYDVNGREVAAVLDEKLPAGEHAVSFDASGLPAGVYFYRLAVGGRRLANGKLVKY